MTKGKELSGVYKITCKENGKVYIGLSRNIKKRIGEHFRGIGSKSLKIDLDKFGKESFEVEILKECHHMDARKYESEFIHKYQSCEKEKGYNVRNNGY